MDRNWPGREVRYLKTISVEDTPEASRGTLLEPRRTRGNSEGQEAEDLRATSAAFSHYTCVQPYQWFEDDRHGCDFKRLAKGGPL